MSTVGNRLMAYEISGYRDRHWVIDGIMEEEDAAIARGRALLHANRYDEVRVVRQRTAPSGFTVESEVFHEAASNVRPVTLAGDPEDVPLCQDAGDVQSLDARLAVGRLMRRYLERENITATELMHVWPYMRRLDDQSGHLLAAAVHAVGTAQAKKLGVPPMKRVGTLQLWLSDIMANARDFGVDRRRIKFDLGDLETAMQRLEMQFEDPVRRRFVLTSLVCYHMMGMGSVTARLEWLFAMFERSEALPELATVTEEMIADAFSFPTVISEMIQSMANRAAVIGRIADAITGRFKAAPGEKIDPLFATFIRLQATRGLPSVVGVLTDWIVREVARPKPLEPRNPGEDEHLFQALLIRIRDKDGMLLGGKKMQESIGAYRLHVRQSVLRGMGMDDQANNLAKMWTVDMVEGIAPLVLQPQ